MKDWWRKRKAKKALKKTGGPEEIGDQHLTGAPQQLGTDTANRVYKTEIDQQFLPKGTESEGYYKPDQTMAPARNGVAASKVAKGTGFDDLIVDTRFAKLGTGEDGATETGALSRKAKGEALLDNVYDTDITDEYLQKHGKLPSPDVLEMDNSIKLKGDRVMTMSGSEMNDIDLSNPETQSGLNRLQWFDALIGNVDRHGANIMVDPATGKVSGIDNDLSFAQGAKVSWGEDYELGNNQHYLGLPDMIDRKTAAKLLKLDEKTIRKLLGPVGQKGTKTDLSDQAIKDTLARLTKIQDKIKELKKSGGVVKKWDQSTYQQQISAPQRKNDDMDRERIAPSYLARHQKQMALARDTDESDYWVKGQRSTTQGARPVAPLSDDDTGDDAKVEDESDELELEDESSSGSESEDEGKSGAQPPEEESVEIATEVVAETNAPEALRLLDELIAELEDLKELGGESGETEAEQQPELAPSDEKDGLPVPTGGFPPLPGLPQRPPVPNVGSDGESESEEKDEEEERKARFRAARSKFANV